MKAVLGILLLVLLNAVLGYKYFQKNIPNGDRVPDAANPNIIWQGVGHLNAKGGGQRNVFGLDFKKHGFVSLNYLFCYSLFLLFYLFHYYYYLFVSDCSTLVLLVLRIDMVSLFDCIRSIELTNNFYQF